MKNDIRINDEPVLNDNIGHYELVGHIVRTLIFCDPPYVIGISGSWGAGKTSFLRKIWGVMGGKFETPDVTINHTECCKEMLNDYDDLRKSWHENTDNKNQIDLNSHGFDDWCVVWFNPWQHQFESNPLIALLQEIRAQYSFMQKAQKEAGKIGSVATYAVLDTLSHAVKTLSLGVIPKLDLDKIEKKGTEYENQHFETPLTSQTFSNYFEKAVELIVGKHGRLLICIDDLDRCEGEQAYRLLESLKLYLNVSNCIFVIGMDQSHLEQNLQHIPTYKDNPRGAREYLDKMLQDRFVLPVPTDMKNFLTVLIDKRKLLQEYTTSIFKDVEQSQVVDVLNSNLPHNPRKIKLFIASWCRYLALIDKQKDGQINWKVTIILTYLAVYEEPIYRSIELSADKFNNELLKFINGNGFSKNNNIYADLELPPKLSVATNPDLGGFSVVNETSDSSKSKDVFWIARLIKEMYGTQSQDGGENSNISETINQHLIDSKYKTPGLNADQPGEQG